MLMQPRMLICLPPHDALHATPPRWWNSGLARPYLRATRAMHKARKLWNSISHARDTTSRLTTHETPRLVPHALSHALESYLITSRRRSMITPHHVGMPLGLRLRARSTPTHRATHVRFLVAPRHTTLPSLGQGPRVLPFGPPLVHRVLDLC